MACLVVALAVAACASDAPSEVGDFAEIQAGDVTITPDAATGTATLRVATTIDAVCAVTYGPTEALGSLATDEDMAGGPHDDHAAIMTGLSPETTYHYRLQGVGSDGRLYRSGLMTFTTPAASGTGAPGPNVAVEGTVVDVSSEFSDGFGASRAIDGDVGTAWSSAGDGDDAYLVVDLGRAVDIVGVGYRTREMTDGSSVVTSFRVTIDGELHGPFPAGPGLARPELAATGRIFRFDVDTSTGGNTGAVEIEIYAAGG